MSTQIVCCYLCDGMSGEPAQADGRCAPCAQWDDYWTSLTPEQQAAEQAAIDRYIDEMEGM